MQILRCRCFLLVALVAGALNSAAAQQEAESKKSSEKIEVEKLDPFKRPEGAITDQSARFYLWYDDDGWHVRTTARSIRVFNGVIRVKDAKIKSCVPIGLKTDKQRTGADAWVVNDARDELQFSFHTGHLSDGFDMAVKGDDGQIEFDFRVDDKPDAKAIFIGRDRKHPSKSPFAFPTKPKVTEESKKADAKGEKGGAAKAK